MPEEKTMPPETAIALLTHKMETMHEDLGEVRSDLKQLVEAFTRLTLIEERQAQHARSMERAFAAIEGHETRIAALELTAPEHTRMNHWFDRGLWAACAALATFLAKKVGLL